MSEHGGAEHEGNLDQLGAFPVTRNLLGEMDPEQEEVIEALAELDAADEVFSSSGRDFGIKRS